jgi:hypothetical protein
MRVRAYLRCAVLVGILSGCAVDREAATAPAAVQAPAQSRVPSLNSYFTHVSVGPSAACAIRRDGTVQCWGQTGAVPFPTVWYREISVGTGVCAIRVGSSGAVDCWGVPGLTPPSPNTGFRRISAASTYACGVKSDRTLHCWGSTIPAGMPTGSSYEDVDVSYLFACALRSDGGLECWGDNTHGQATPPTPNTGFVQVSTGLYHACAVRATGRVACWGENSGGRGSPPNRNFGFVQVSAGANHNWAKRNDATIFCWGDNAFGQIIPTNPNSGFFDLDAGGLVTCAIRLFGDLDCWGESGYQVDDPSPTFFKWTGFLSPIVNPPSVNHAAAGSIVVLPFKLGSDEGLDIFTTGFPRVAVCGGGGGTQPATGQLAYDAAKNTYFYLWQTDAAWAGSCRRYTLGLRDGTHHSALVQF